MLEQNQDQLSNKLPWWTWLAPLFLIELGNQLSLVFVYSDSYSAFYLPTSVAIILIQWWGPARVLPAMLIESTYNSWFYGISNLWLWPVFGIVETLAVFLSWYLFARLAKGKAWLPDTRYAVRFIFLGIIWPLVFEVACWEVVYILDGKNVWSVYWGQFSRDILSELIVNFSFTLPVLYFFTPHMNTWKLLHQINAEIRAVRMPFLKTHYFEIAFVFSLLLFLTFVLSFAKFWFVYGIFSLYLAIRFGFGMALIGNAFIFFITYLLPALAQNLWHEKNFIINEEITNTYLGSLLLYLFTTITGRTISDLRSIETRLHHQNDELQQTNKELDHFVYSVSHDLSAPLKSILGLVSISRLSDKLEDQRVYLSKIETSVFKLDAFIKEVLDYSRNKRSEVVIEKFSVQELCVEVLDNLKHMDEFRKIQVDVTALEGMQVHSDKTRMKIILNNLLSNAIKYQKKQADHQPLIKIYPQMSAEGLHINIKDNGEGINPAVMNRIFDMFFRGHQNSSGSGLGLYIAREAAEKINGTITVKSDYGKGSVFSLVLRNVSA